MVRRAFKWLGIALFVLVVVLPTVFVLSFLGIQAATEYQWLGKAPQHDAIDARSREPHSLALLDEGFDSLATRLRLIDSATQSIELEFFIYELDEASRVVTQALARKAQQGVKVRILVDFSVAVFKLAPQYVKSLQAAGVEVRYYNTAGIERFFAANHRTHRKLLAVDRRQAIVGGRNIGNDYFDLSPHYNFLDSDLLIEGPIVASIVDSFELYWASDWVTPPDMAAAAPAPTLDLLSAATQAEQALLLELQQHPLQHQVATCDDVQFVTDYPGSGVERRKVFSEITRLALEADHHILVESPYLVLRDTGADVVRGMTQRGVQVQFLTNSLHSTDAFYTVARLADGVEDLSMPNLQVWAYNGDPLAHSTRASASNRWGVHAKRAVFDDDTVVVGTYNMDPRSANLNSELIVVCRGSTELAAAMKRSIQARLEQSRPITGTAQASGYEGLIQGADEDAIFRMRMVTPIANWLDFLM